jgi:formylglycine-generating enzyme required for sulfatase activity
MRVQKQNKQLFLTTFYLAALLVLLQLFQVSAQAASEGDQAAKKYLDNVVSSKAKFSSEGKIPASEPAIPADVKAIESKARKIYKNDKGFWEADYGDGIIMVYIPPGKFTMGQTKEEAKWLMDTLGEKGFNHARLYNEIPLHTVYLDGYWIAKTEVTIKQFKLFVKDTGYVTEAESSGGSAGYNGKTWKTMEGITWKNPGFKQEDNHPVVCVSWNDTAKYCKWISGKTGVNFNLATEAQWEKAARWTDSRKYSWGNHEPYYNGQWYANFASSLAKRGEDGFVFTSPVGSYPQGASYYGVLDLSGNVWEWAYDWHKPDYYKDSPQKNPAGPESGTTRAIRGGGWGGDGARVLRCAERGESGPFVSCSGMGFRICHD